MRRTKKFALLLTVSFGVYAIVGCQSLVSTMNLSKKNTTPVESTNGGRQVNLNDPQDEKLLCEETARTMANSGYAREAILLFEKAEQMGATKTAYNDELASLYASNGNFDQAIERYEKSLESEMSAEQLNNFLWTLMESDRLDHAYQESLKAIERFPNDNRLQSTLAVIEYKRGNREIALGLFEKVQGAASAYHNIAVLDIDSGNPTAAKRSLELAIKMSTKPNPMTVELLKQLNEHSRTTASNQHTAKTPY